MKRANGPLRHGRLWSLFSLCALVQFEPATAARNDYQSETPHSTVNCQHASALTHTLQSES
eukprot:6264653-Amphidinium_carterae.1